MTVRILAGDCRSVLATLPDRSVQACVTSPPYFGLRDYGTASWEGGDAACDHKQGRNGAGRADGVVDDRAQRNRDGVGSMGGNCGKCGATHVDSQIGLEQTPDAYVAELVAVFREVRRVLRDDGTLWLNLGDSYAMGGYSKPHTGLAAAAEAADGSRRETSGPRAQNDTVIRAVPAGTKPKDLLGIPWLVAFALRADGWYLRQDIIWAKPNPMPESVTDRCTKAHEYVFLLSKQARYFYDAKAVAEEASGREPGNVSHKLVDASLTDDHHRTAGGLLNVGARDTRNRRSVWTIATQPYSGAHFATMPPDLAETCIKAGSSERGQCPTCGSPWVRMMQVTAPDGRTVIAAGNQRIVADDGAPLIGNNMIDVGVRGSFNAKNGVLQKETIGWAPSCSCPAHQPVPQTILDPFGGAGTTALVADRLQRDAIIIELNQAYADIARDRINGDGGLFAEVAAE